MNNVATVNTEDSARLLHEHIKSIDSDQDFWFKLRGDNDNVMIDAATPLLGLSLHIRALGSCDSIARLYQQVQEEVKAIEMEVAQTGEEHAVIMAYRYILCAVLDEAVMSTSWGAQSQWAEHSLLTRFHNETWGGEKVFVILSRLLEDPRKYRLLLEFIYLSLMLGFEGKYKIVERGAEERELVARRLYDTLSSLDERELEPLTSATDHVLKTRYRLNSQTPIWLVLTIFVGLWSAIFIFYHYLLDVKTMDVLEQLNHIL